MRHDGEKFRLRLARRFGLETCFPLKGQLLGALLGLFAVGDVAQRDDLDLLVIPLGVDHSQLRVDHPAAALDDVDLGRLPDEHRKPE